MFYPFSSCVFYTLFSSVVDRVANPNPYRIRIQLGQWIRIRIRNLEPDPGGQKLPQIVEHFFFSRKIFFLPIFGHQDPRSGLDPDPDRYSA
jgi:hypothetical protein